MIKTLQIPAKLGCLYQPKRYKVLYGGRGAGRSWGVADALVAKAMEKRVRIGCFREIQNSIKESVHRLLKDRIEKHGVGYAFDTTDQSIKCNKTGSEFIFEGLYRNVNRIKSLEAIDIAWVEEAEKVSDDSWGILIPTIRMVGSEIWVTFNPQYEDDATYQRFVIDPPKDAYVVPMTYADNPWFPEVLFDEMERDKARDYRKYENIWLGRPIGTGRRVWPVFNRDTHVKTFPAEALASANCYMAMDPHSKYYPFLVWVAIIKKNERGRPEDFHRHVYAEWPTFDDLGGHYHDLRHQLTFHGKISDLSDIIKKKDSICGGKGVLAHFVDPRYAKGAGGWNWSTSTEGLVEQFKREENGGLNFQLPEITLLDSQHQVIHSEMVWDQSQAISWGNEPSFSVSPLCRNVIASLMNHRLEDGSEKESEKYKDPSDALRICWAGFQGRGFEGLFREKIPMDAPVSDYGWGGRTKKKNVRTSEAWRTV
jgi:hypothetical protein